MWKLEIQKLSQVEETVSKLPLFEKEGSGEI